jgi:phosphate transport system substrate-binding protein
MRQLLLCFCAVALLVACKGGGDSSAGAPSAGASGGSAPTGGDTVTLTGSGSTFVMPLMSRWAADYPQVEKNVRVNYQSVGSGAGVRAISDKTVDFGASDAAMTDEQLGKAGGILHVPATLGAVVVAYNLKEIEDHLKLSPEVVSGIFLGEIKVWNDPKIAALNPGAKLPAQPIGIAYRSDGSGTTAVFTDYLAKVSPAWKDKVGTGTSVKWPTGTGAKGNEGVTNQIKQTPGAIGYIELAYALQNKLSKADIKNKSGKFVEASLDSITAAAAAYASTMPDDLRQSLTDAAGDAAYPIASFVYVLVYEDAANPQRATAVANFLWWVIHDGQKLGPPLHYAQLPAEVVTKTEGKLKLLKSGGKPLLAGK